MPPRSDRVHIWVMICTMLTMVAPFWLPLNRGLLDGPSYAWGWWWGLGGHGTGGDYWVLVLMAACGLPLLYLGWRGARPPFHLLLLLWHGALTAGSILVVRQNPGLRFRGDTLGIDVPIGWVLPTLYGAFFLLAAVWVLQALRGPRPQAAPPWTRWNRIWLTVALLLYPVEFVLLRFGGPESVQDKVGVILLLLQWVILNLGLAPRGAAGGRAAVADPPAQADRAAPA